MTRRLLDHADRLARRPLPTFLALFVASALLNVLVGLIYGYRANAHTMDMDEQEYYGMASQILAGHWDLGSRRTLLYPMIIAGLRLIDDEFRFVLVAISLLAAFAAPLLFLVARRLSGSAGLGLLAGTLLALWPTQFFLATSLYSETLALPCFLLFLLALPLGSRAIGFALPRAMKASWHAVLAGLALGATAHIRPMYLVFLPFALVIPFIEERSPRGAARTALLVGLGFTLVVLPWSAWMTSRWGEPIILTANGGETLAGGLNPTLATMKQNGRLRLAKRETWSGPGKWLPPEQTGYLSKAETQLSYEAQSRLLQQRTLAWIVANPREALRIELSKLGYMWGCYAWHRDNLVKLLAGNLPVMALLALTLVAFWRAPGRWLGLARLWVVPLFTSGVALISWGSWRFRQPADAALLAFCVIAWGIMLRGARDPVRQ